MSGLSKLHLMSGDGKSLDPMIGKSSGIVALHPDGVNWRRLTLLSLRKQSQPKGAWVARFRENVKRTHAEDVAGWSLFIREKDRAALPDGEFYVDQLIGLKIVSDTGRSFGTLTEVITAPANDVYVTDKDVMVPAVPDFILNIDVENQIMTVRDVPGLLDE